MSSSSSSGAGASSRKASSRDPSFRDSSARASSAAVAPGRGFRNPLDAWLARQCGVQDADANTLARALREARARALTRCLNHAAARSAFYARSLAGYDLERFTPEDMRGLPFTTADDLARWEDFLCVSRGEVQRMVTLRTSGTTGSPKRLAFTETDLARTVDFFRVGMSQLVRPGQKLAVLLPGAARPDGVADLLRQSLSPCGVEVCTPPQDLLVPAKSLQQGFVKRTPPVLPIQKMVQEGVAHCALGSCPSARVATPQAALAGIHPDIVQWLDEVRPHCLVAAPGQLEGLLRHFPKSGPPGLCGLLSSADRLDPVLGHVLSTVWNCTVLDHYGLTETAYGGAVECPAHDGYHLRLLDLVVEIVDFCGDEPLPPGETGEVVITTLEREAMPLIRYRTGDVACLLPGPCACGSPLSRLGPVQGRLERCGNRVRVVQMPKGGTPAGASVRQDRSGHDGPYCTVGDWEGLM